MAVKDVSEGDKQYIRDYVSAAPTAQAKKERRQECADVFGLDLSQVAAISAHASGKLAQRRVAPVQPQAFGPPPTFAEMPAGVALDYDNPPKRMYRNALLGKGGFVDRHTVASERRHQRVLVFPGRKCLEIPYWLELGYTPSNIVGCECEASAWPEFLYNASRYGISVRTTDVLNIAGEDAWDAVHLDYCGPIGNDMINHLRNLKLKRKGIYAHNLLAGRENESAQLLIDYYFSAMSGLRQFLSTENFIDALHGMAALKQAQIHSAQTKEQQTPDVEIRDKRDTAIPMAVMHHISHEWRPTYRTHPSPVLPKHLQVDEAVRRCLVLFFKGLWRCLVAFGPTPEEGVEAAHRILELFDTAMSPYHLISEAEQWSYVSPSRQKFLCDFYVMELVNPFGTVSDEVVNFINQGVAAMALHGMAAQEIKTQEELAASATTYNWGFQIRCRDRSTPHFNTGYKATQADSIECMVGGCSASSLRVRSMNSAITRMHEMIRNRSIYAKDRNTGSVVRKMLIPTQEESITPPE